MSAWTIKIYAINGSRQRKKVASWKTGLRFCIGKKSSHSKAVKDLWVITASSIGIAAPNF
jgi:hypothetical protein